MIHSRTPTSTSGFHQLPPALKRSVRTSSQCSSLGFQLAIPVLNALPITFPGLIGAGDRIQPHLRPSLDQEDIFNLRVVRRANWPSSTTSRFKHFLSDLGDIFILFLLLTRLLLLTRRLLNMEVEGSKWRRPNVHLRVVEQGPI